MANEATIDFYGRMASHYDDTVQKAGYRVAATIYEWLAPYLDGTMNHVLDLGIGTGLASEQFSTRGYDVTGVDGSDTMLGLCRKKQVATALIKADLSDGVIPVSDRRFDIILCIGMFEFVLKPEAFIRNVSAVIAPHGLFALALRDPALNPQFTSMELEGRTIDRSAYEEHAVIAVHHKWEDIQRFLERASLSVLEEKLVFAYKSPTQGFDTMNRIVICRYQEHEQP